MCSDSMKVIFGCENTLVPICTFHFMINCIMMAGAEYGFFFFFLNNWKVILSEVLRFQSQSPVFMGYPKYFCVALPVLL